MGNSEKAERIKYLTRVLNEASRAYYMEDSELMSNYEYDALYDELKVLEEETGIVLAGSPTVRVGYEVLSELPKVEHQYPMLSLDKTKDVGALTDWLLGHSAVLSWKMDGLTIVLNYEGGELIQAVTRGNGYIGEVITSNAKVFKNVPHKIAFKGKLTLRGEAVIKYSDFNRMNSMIPDSESKYKNPRNLCSGSVRQLNNEITAKRNVYFFAFALVVAEGVDFYNSRMAQFEWMRSQGFDVVEHFLVSPDDLAGHVADFANRISENDFPSDGLVMVLEDIAYGESLGNTAKFPRNAIAFKWADEVSNTHLIEVEWSASRTGLINPVAIFEPVELEGTTVARASLHNVSILRALQLGVGDEIQVYKANMIIPQIAENLTRSDTLQIPCTCPVCGGPTIIKTVNEVAALYCENPDCDAKHIKRFGHFVSRDAFNIEGLSESTLEKFIQKGFLHELSDIFRLKDRHDEIISMEGLGEKSYQKLIKAIDKSRKVELPKLIYSLGILNIGLANAKLLCQNFNYDYEKLIKADVQTITNINGLGPVIAQSFVSYFEDEKNMEAFYHLLSEIVLEEAPASGGKMIFEGMTFVITGSVEHFKNRNEVKAVIEKLGGKVAGSVSAKTNYLINNDVTSGSSKNKKAKELGVEIIDEQTLIKMMEEEA